MGKTIKWVILLDIVLAFCALGIWLNNYIRGEILFPLSILVIAGIDVAYIRHRRNEASSTPADKSRQAWAALAIVFGASAIGGFANFVELFNAGRVPIYAVLGVTIPIVIAFVSYREYAKAKSLTE